MSVLGRVRKGLAAAVVLAGATAFSLVAVPGASAQEPPSTLTIQKLVGGSPVPGTVFTENVVCVDDEQTVTLDVDLFFDEHGAPTLGTDPVIDGNPGDTCTVTETVTGGAIVVYYECDDLAVVSGCSDSGPSETPLSVTFDIEGGNDALITVTNGFVNFPPNGGPPGTPNTIPPPKPFPTPTTVPVPTPRPAPVPVAVAVTPRFTG